MVEQQATPAVGAPPSLAARLAAMPADRWVKCPNCSAFIYHKRLEKNLKVCPECTYHFRLSARERIAYLLDAGSFEERDAEMAPGDPLGFVDSKPYPAAHRRVPAQEQCAGGGGLRRRHNWRLPGRDLRARLHLPRWQHGLGRRREGDARGRTRRRDAHAGDRLLGLRRRADAGRHRLADADGEDLGGAGGAGRARRALLLAPDRPDLRRRQRVSSPRSAT